MARANDRVWITLWAAVAAVAVAGCTSSGSGEAALSESVPLPDGISACEDVFGADKVIDPKTFGEACSQGGEMIVPRPVKLNCVDEKLMLWNDFAWGYENQPMTMIDSGLPVQDQGPYDAAIECLKSASTEEDQ
jgi:hypothetical protein